MISFPCRRWSKEWSVSLYNFPWVCFRSEPPQRGGKDTGHVWVPVSLHTIQLLVAVFLEYTFPCARVCPTSEEEVMARMINTRTRTSGGAGPAKWKRKHLLVFQQSLAASRREEKVIARMIHTRTRILGGAGQKMGNGKSSGISAFSRSF